MGRLVCLVVKLLLSTSQAEWVASEKRLAGDSIRTDAQRYINCSKLISLHELHVNHKQSDYKLHYSDSYNFSIPTPLAGETPLHFRDPRGAF